MLKLFNKILDTGKPPAEFITAKVIAIKRKSKKPTESDGKKVIFRRIVSRLNDQLS